MATPNTSKMEHLEDVLAELRDELAAVKADRERLEKQLASIGEMQTETIALDEAEVDEILQEPSLPSLDDLMATLDSIAEAPEPPTHTNSTTSVEMLAPELVFPEAYEASGDERIAAEPIPRANTRILVLTDAQPPIKYPLYKNEITIGRSKAADITVDSRHISRIHARIKVHENSVIVEDVSSKNGIRINAEPITKHLLRHGDVLSMGKAHFTFIETG